jgi:hypothetical protein
MATVSGGTPMTTNGFCSPAFDMKGVEQRVAIEPTATRLRMIGGVDIILLPREGGPAVRLRVIAMEGLGGGSFVTARQPYGYLFRFSGENSQGLR